MSTSRIVVTGAGGFLGGRIATALIAAGHSVTVCLSRSGTALPGAARTWSGILPAPEFPALLAEQAPDWIVHCAGSSSVGASLIDPAADHQRNVVATAAVYEAAAAAAPRARLILLSSAAVYGQPDLLPIRESTPPAPLSPYGHHKLAAEQIACHHFSSRGASSLILRIFSAYGPGLRKQVLYDLYRKGRDAAVIRLEGDGSEERDFIHVDDIVRVVHWAIDRRFRGLDTLNLASGNSLTIHQLALRFLQALGWRRGLSFSGERGSGTPRIWRVDPARLRSLGLSPGLPLMDGLQQYAAWLQQSEGAIDADRNVAAAG